MILYYAVGGGLGHVTRARRVLETLGLVRDAAIVTASPYARDPRMTGGIRTIFVPPALERDSLAHRMWMRSLHADRMIVDTFPGGIHGELCGLDVPMDYVARLLKWEEYRRAVPHALPRFGTTYVMEELTHEVECDTRVILSAAKDLPSHMVEDPSPSSRLRMTHWLIVHSGPAHEVLELVAYASELRRIEPVQRILVATQCDVALPESFERIDAYPVNHLFEPAAKIISAAGFNVMIETEPFREKHVVVPFARRFDDQFLRAARRRLRLGRTPGEEPRLAAAELRRQSDAHAEHAGQAPH